MSFWETPEPNGMFDGDLREGELEIGQVSSMITELESAGEIVEKVWSEYLEVLRKIAQ